MMIELYDAWLKDLGFTLNTPRNAKARGGHISLVHPEAKEGDQVDIGATVGWIDETAKAPAGGAKLTAGSVDSLDVDSASIPQFADVRFYPNAALGNKPEATCVGSDGFISFSR